MGNGCVCRWRALVVWVVCVALLAGVVGGAVLVPARAAAQGSAPAAAGSAPGVELSVGGAAHSVAAGDYFTGTVTSYGASSSDTAVVGVSVSGSAVALAPVGAGSATVTVTATNTAGSAVQAFSVRVLPAGCVVALGVLAVGAVTTRAGSWKSDDGCGATNGAGAGDRYARYYTFTVPEAVEARFALASSRSNRLYLLDGAGTGGRVVASAGDAGATWAASLRRVLAPGAYTLETTTNDAASEATFGVSIDSMPLSPPAGCVASLGALTAGTPTAREGSWARDDGCRSVNATSNEESRYFARYVSFTVTEALRVRFRLASVRGARLFLLEGAGAAGRVLASATTRSSRTAATLGRLLQPGAYTLETTAHQQEREADFTLDISPALTAPQTAVTPTAQTVAAGATATVDVAAAFTGTVESYTATSSDTAAATVSVAGSVVTITGIAPGAAAVTVVATNSAGRATQSFTVTVSAVTAPMATGTLAAQTLPAGDNVTVDVAGAFAGTVDSYVVTSSNAAVVDVALTGSTITLTGIAAGTATVAVTATNTAGSATQSIAVTVNLPSAPTLADPLAAQTLQATETRTIDVASGFDGRIDTYTATSGNTDTLTVTADGPTVALIGVTVGSTTVTVTAINAAGRAARSLTVTVDALTAPQTAGTPLARTIAVGAEVPLRIADAFTGIVHTYTATSSDTTIATASADGPTVTLVGVAAGTATITLTAANTAGSATATFTVTVEAPDELAIAVAAPSHCLGSEGTLAPGGGRRGVGHIDLTYHITGGAGPYTITSPDAPDTTHTEPTGTLTISCAKRGIDLTTAGPDINVVEAGPRTLTLIVTDNTGTTRTANVGIEVAENAYTTEYNNGLMHEGRTYILGTPDEWVLITLPEGLTLQFAGLSEGRRAHFAEPATGAEIVLDWTTGTEIGRTIPIAGEIGRAQRSDSGNPLPAKRPSTHAVRTLLNSFTASTAPPPRDVVRDDTGGKDWRPYGHVSIQRLLTAGTTVGVHPKMREGESLTVCTPQPDAYLQEILNYSIAAWNSRIKSTYPSFSRDIFTYVASCNSDSDVQVHVKDSTEIKEHCKSVPPGCADDEIKGLSPGSAPEVTGKDIYIREDHVRIQATTPSKGNRLRVMMHELGHMLGLGDYPECNSPIFKSLMAGGKCTPGDAGMDDWGVAQDLITDTDLGDLHAIYHPGARTDMYFKRSGSILGDMNSWTLVTGNAPMIFDEDGELLDDSLVSNAFSYVVYRHKLDWRPPLDFVGEFKRTARVARPESELFGHTRFVSPGSISQIRGRAFVVAGVTRGDIHTRVSQYVGEHFLQSLDPLGYSGEVKDWTLGGVAIVHGPPTVPLNVRASAADGSVFVMWDPARGATDYDVFWDDEPIGDPPVGSVSPVGHLGVQNVPAGSSGPCGVVVRVSEGIANGTTYSFRVRANQSHGDFYSDLSANASATPRAFRPPRGSAGTALSDSQRATANGGGSAQSNPCTVGLPPQVVPVVEESASCPTDEHPWTLRAVGDGFVCDRPDSAAVTPGERVVSCPSVVPEHAVVSVGGVEKCRRTLTAAPAETLGDPECGDGFAPVNGGASCSMTDTIAATAKTTYSCDDGYTLVNLGTPLCSRNATEPATVVVTYECDDGDTFVPGPVGGGYCRKTVPATPTVSYLCPPGYGLVTFQGVSCYRSEKATQKTEYYCESGFSLVRIPLGGQYCRKSVAAKETVSYSCPPGYGLVTFQGVSCYRSEKATQKTEYYCESGFSLVRVPLGGRYCRKSVSATATYSCASGYTRSGAICYKYTYTNLTGARCPAGYTLFFNGLYHLCRKRVTAAATVTYSCSSGTLSGSKCLFTAAPKSRTTYSCSSGTLSGSRCVFTAAPTPKTTYSCSSGTLSGSRCVFTAAPTPKTTYSCSSGTLSGSRCVFTAAPTPKTTYSCNSGTLSGTDCVLIATPKSRTTYSCSSGTLSGTRCVFTAAPNTKVTYHCNNAPAGYNLSDTDCIKTTTQAPTRPTIYTCLATYTRNEPADTTGPPTCTRTETVDATVTTTPASCPTAPRDEPPYRLITKRIASVTSHTCIRTITVDATITRTYTCPTEYRLEKTISHQETRPICRLKQDS